LLPDTEKLVEILDSYDDVYWSKYYAMMASKLGLMLPRQKIIPLSGMWKKL
jgi:uncharacterized protein YdiU (UPF0061 family)